MCLAKRSLDLGWVDITRRQRMDNGNGKSTSPQLVNGLQYRFVFDRRGYGSSSLHNLKIWYASLAILFSFYFDVYMGSERTAPPNDMDAPFEYIFPGIRGVQASREYYVSMCPMRLIPKIFLFDEEELVPELRAQRVLNKARLPEMARYMVDHPKDYYFFSAHRFH